MKNRFVKFFAVLLAVFMLLPFVVAADSYSTYTYSIDGTQLASPHAYTPNMSINWTDMGLPQALVKVEDMVVDKAGNVYLVDETLSTVFVLDKNFKYKFHINSFINSNGIEDSLNTCRGCYVTDEYIYVADTYNKRIVLFDLEGNYVRHLEEPKSDIFE